MKRKCVIFSYIIFLAICLVCGGLGFHSAFADVNNFHFSDFTGDYYLYKGPDALSHLKVVESVTAVFPDYDQNKGICRQIAYTNQGGANITLPSLTRSNLKLTRNGEPESIYSITKEDGYYNVCTGTDEYVRGEQTYVFEYEFEKVVTEFNDNGREYQELYWDTNGNGATQKFDSVTARLHFADNLKVNYNDKSWCYVGRYGESGQDRCVISEIDDGVQFKAKNLRSHENLTFDVELAPKVFIVPEPEKNYAYVWITVALGGVCLLCIILTARKYIKSREQANYYKGIFVKPEYQPHKEYGLTEMAEIYLGKKKDVKVAMLLEMIVQHKIELVKGEKKKWSIVVKQDVEGEYADLLKILNGGSKVAVDDTIKVERHTATNQLVNLKKDMQNKVINKLKADKLIDDKYKFGDSQRRGVGNMIAMTIIIVPVLVMIGVFIMEILDGWLELSSTYGGVMVFYEHFYPTALAIIVVTVIICVFLGDRSVRYKGFTNAGLEASKYMEGLKLYIEMAEAERMKLLQSVEGADTTAKGIVKLYEKLLPYAAVFGLEESWMDEMKEYCQVEEIEEPDYLMNDLMAHEIARSLSSAASYANTATVMSSSGGGSSSGFSGGGGGGFSGGGGGGGGFSGR